ncbi:MAG: thiamine diphosphokinase [Desulfitobacteriaceae bacterium]
MRIAVLANGSWNSEWGKQELSDVGLLICADGGGNSALLSDRRPDVLIGDLDSITPENLANCVETGTKIQRFPKEKDQTDLELALQYAQFQVPIEFSEGPIWLYGATGGRIDHFLGNIALLLAYARQGRKIYLKDPEHLMWIVQERENIFGHKGQEISLIALTEKAVVTTEGFYYPLNHEKLYQDSPRGISNIFLGTEGFIQVDEGRVLVIMHNA